MLVVRAFFDAVTSTLSYVVHDPASRDAVILDPVLDFDPKAVTTTETALAPVVAHVREAGLVVRMILETHAHADHLSGAQPLKKAYPRAPLAIGAGILPVQARFRGLFALGADFATDGSQFDRLLHDEELVTAGTLAFRVLFTPGHTEGCASYHFPAGDGLVFTGDALFMPDGGVGRCDFPGGDARLLYQSVTRKLYLLPPQTLAHTCHDYQPNGRALRYAATIDEQRRTNAQLRATTGEAEFVAFRTTRDATLDAPRLLYPSVQVNVAAGRLPKPLGSYFRPHK